MKRWWMAVVLGMCGAIDAIAQSAAAQTTPLVFNPLARPRPTRSTAEPPLAQADNVAGVELRRPVVNPPVAPIAPPVANPLAMPHRPRWAGSSGFQTVPMRQPITPVSYSEPAMPDHAAMPAANPAPFLSEAETHSYSALAGEGCAGGRCGRSARPWRETFAWEDGCDACSVCGPLGRVWGSAEFLYWWTNSDKLPPLVTTSSPGTAEAVAGVLGVGSTQVLFPDGSVNGTGASGLRLGVGGWINRAQTIGVQAGFIHLADQEVSFNAASDATGNLILARPFNRFNTGVPDPGAQLVAFPGVFAGEISVSDRTTFGGWDTAVRANLYCDTNWRVDGLLGYRHLYLRDRLQISNGLTALAGAAGRGILPGTQILGTDYFRTSNEFNGVDVGFTGEYRLGNLAVTGLVKAAYGYNWAVSDVSGITYTTVNGVTVTSPGNLLALQSNSRFVGRNKGTIVPELGLNLGWDVTSNVRLKFGYSYIYFDRIFRPGGQIDDNVNTNLIPPSTGIGPANPAPILQQTNTAIHGISAGIELRY